MHVICPKCSFYFPVEVSGRRQQADCPQCGAFAGSPDHEGGLIVKCVCRRCALGYPVDALAPRAELACPSCGLEPKHREKRLLARLSDIYCWRRSSPEPPPETGAELVDLDEMDVGPSLAARLPSSMAFAYRCVPIRFEDGILTVALAGAVREGVLDDLSMVLGCPVHGAAAAKAAVSRLLRKIYAA